MKFLFVVCFLGSLSSAAQTTVNIANTLNECQVHVTLYVKADSVPCATTAPFTMIGLGVGMMDTVIIPLEFDLVKARIEDGAGGFITEIQFSGSPCATGLPLSDDFECGDGIGTASFMGTNILIN